MLKSAVKISLLPKRIGVDAIIVYKDILTPLSPMGAHFRFDPGPILKPPIRTQAQVDALQPVDNPSTQLTFTGNVIRRLRETLNNELPLIGFAGCTFDARVFPHRRGESHQTRDRYIREGSPCFPNDRRNT